MEYQSTSVKCPICGSETKYVEKKRILGKSKKYVCTIEECSTELDVEKNGLKLHSTNQKDNGVWTKYKFQILTDREWNNISEGGVSDRERKELDRINTLDKIRNGIVDLQTIDNVPIILKKNEIPYLSIPSVEFHEDRMVRHSTGGAVRIMKGVYLGGSRSESHPERRHIDTGQLVLTNRRLVFVGSRKSIDADLRKIVSLEPYEDGIAVNRSNKKNTEWFIRKFDDVIINGKTDREDVNITLDGLVLKYLIEGAIAKLG